MFDMSENNNRPWYFWIYQPYKWLIFLPLFTIFSIICATLASLFSILISSRAGSFWGKSWGRIVCYITPLRIFVKGKKNVVKGKSYVIVSNHQTIWDIFLLYGFLPIDFRWIMKKELRKVPFIGYACEKVGHIFIDRSSPKVALKSLNEAKRKLVDGTSVLVFPEGTRSGQHEMRPFKRGAFKLATDLELDILPVTVVNSYKILRRGFFNLLPAKAGIIIHPAIHISDYHGNMDELMEETRVQLKMEKK